MKNIKIYKYYEIPISQGQRLYAWTINKNTSELFKSQRDMSVFIFKKEDISSSDIKRFESSYPSERLDIEPITTKKSALNTYLKSYVPMAVTMREVIENSRDDIKTAELRKITDKFNGFDEKLLEYLKPDYEKALDILGLYFSKDWLNGIINVFEGRNNYKAVDCFDDFELFCRRYSWCISWGRK